MSKKNNNQNEVPVEKKLTSEDAKMMIEKERQERVATCREVVQKALTEYKCTIDAQFILSANNISPIINIVATE